MKWNPFYRYIDWKSKLLSFLLYIWAGNQNILVKTLINRLILSKINNIYQSMARTKQTSRKAWFGAPIPPRATIPSTSSGMKK